MLRMAEPETDLQCHLEPEILAAFAEKALSDSERTKMFAHLAQCEACREWLALHAAGRPTSGRRLSHTAAQAVCAAALAVFMFVLAHQQGPDSKQRTLEPAASTPATSWLFAHDFAAAATVHAPVLPSAFASVKLARRVSFQTVSSKRETQKGGMFNRRRLSTRILLKTTTGMRWISVSL